MAQLERMIGKRDALETRQEAWQRVLFIAAEVFHDTTERLFRQQHELTGLYNKITGEVPDTASLPAGRGASRRPSVTDETHPLRFNCPRPS